MKFVGPIKLTFDVNLAYFIGVLQGDGCVRNYPKGSTVMVSITVSKKDRDYMLLVKGIMRKLFKVGVYVYDSKRGAYEIYITKRGIVRAVEPYKKNLIIPDEIKNSNDKTLAAYIRGLFDTDGTCYYGKRFRSGSVSFSNKEYRLIGELKNILERRFSIYAGIVKNTKNGYDPVFKLTIWNKSNILKFRESIGFIHPRKKKLLEKLCVRYKTVTDRFMPKFAEKAILNLLKTEGHLSTNQISIKLNRHRETVKEHLDRMEGNELVKKIVVNFNRWGQIEKPCLKKFIWMVP